MGKVGKNLDEETVIKIREMHKKQFTYEEIAEYFGLTIRTVIDIVKRRTWKTFD